MNGPTIKIVLLTDSKTINMMLKGMLNPLHYATTVLHSSANDLFDSLIKGQPDIIFLRTELKHANGLEICDQIKQESALSKTRVVFLSSNPKVREQAKKHDADRFLTMPFTITDVVKTITSLMLVKPVILFVEDSDVMHSTVVPALKEEGFDLLQAWNGEEALNLIDQHADHIDIIVSDISMPGMDGIQLCKTFRCNRTKDIPFILLTSMDSEESISQGFEAGADDYVIKPVLIPELISRIQRLLQTEQSQEINRPEKILVVDDSPMIRGIMLTALHSHGFQVETAEHGIEALAKIKMNHFQLLITNYDMPHMNGLDLCLKIRQTPSRIQNIPIIFITERNAKADEIRVKSVGIQAFFTKPFNMDRFMAEIERVLAMVRLKRQDHMLTHYFPERALTRNSQPANTDQTIADKQFRTILFTGIKNFHALGKKLGAEKLIEFLNHYFAAILEIMEQFQVIADGVLEERLFLSFGHQDQGAMKAIHCAQEMHKTMIALQQQTGVQFDLQTGIHSGHLILGVLNNAPQHCKMTLIGANIHIARLVKDIAAANQIALSETTFALVQSLINTQPIGFATTQTESIRVFAVIE